MWAARKGEGNVNTGVADGDGHLRVEVESHHKQSECHGATGFADRDCAGSAMEIGGGTLESHQKNMTRDLTRAL